MRRSWTEPSKVRTDFSYNAVGPLSAAGGKERFVNLQLIKK